VRIEDLTIRNANRAIRFMNETTGNVVRRVAIRDTVLGIGGWPGQTDFYIADNILEGRLEWPLKYSDDGGAHGNDDGIRVLGSGHVVAYNRISGYGDAMKVEQEGARAVDFYGNDVLWSYDNGVELDLAEGNVRCWRNRFTNTLAAISAQPVYGGPAYIARNIVLNTEEQLKFKPLGPAEPSGMLVYNNTFVAPVQSLNLQTGGVSHYFALENNLFVGPDPLTQRFGFTIDWGSPNDGGIFDYNGYSPDGKFGYGWFAPLFYRVLANLADVQNTLGYEAHGMILTKACDNGSPFASCLAAPASLNDLHAPPEPHQLRLPRSSNAIGSARPLPNVNVRTVAGRQPDLGAVQSGCPGDASFGPRSWWQFDEEQAVSCR
jgi:hypothetical protein